MTNDRFYTVQEMANMLKVSIITIRRAIKAGRIQAFRVGSGAKSPYRIAGTEIDRIMVMNFDECMKNIRSLK